ncbi:MAG: methyltransferase domain-containing protein [Chloroflexi bacterium]|nr:methyltransferase domain-containing protein [Chloroflexota bacterium]
MNPTQHFMQVFFHLLYHPFAFTYDLVAATVSFGRWKDWTREVLPFIKGTRILELGYGPGHLQRFLLDLNFAPVAIDESAQMGVLAKRNIGKPHKLTRGLAQHLPFDNASFDCIVSTFPTEYIFHEQTLSEISRCLSDRGRLIVLPVAWPKSGVLKWLYQVTGEIPADRKTSIQEKMMKPFIAAGFESKIEIVELQSATIMIIVANK